MADKVTTTKTAKTDPPADGNVDQINSLVEQLRDALVDGGMPEDHAEALLHGVVPDADDAGVVGNLADLQRMGAAAAKGEDASMEAAVAAAPDPAPAPEV
jgi:hypothetical protein